MTRIILVVDAEYQATYTIDDPRPARELVKLINTGEMIVGQGEMLGRGPKGGAQQWAMLQFPLAVVTVVLDLPPVRLGPRHYEVLFGLADLKRAGQIAGELGISRRTVYEYIHELKTRLKAETIEEMLVRAAEHGLVERRVIAGDYP